MKRWLPLFYLLAAAAAAAGLMLVLGGVSLKQHDHDPAMVRAGGILAYLRDGQAFDLGEIYPEPWDRVQFARDEGGLGMAEVRKLYGYDPGLAQRGVPLLLFWRDGELSEVLPMAQDAEGYPRFMDALMEENFSLSREAARFVAVFVPGDDGRSGYYRCTPQGEQL